MKKKWNLLFLFAFIVSMITLAGCGKQQERQVRMKENG